MLAITMASMTRALRGIESPPHPRSTSLLEEALTIAQAAGSRHATAVALVASGDLAWRRGETHAAANHWRHALELRCEIQDARGVAAGLERAALSAIASGDAPRAVRMFSAAESERERLGLVLHYDEAADHEHWLDAARNAQEPEEFMRNWTTGRGLSRLEATRQALDPVM